MNAVLERMVYEHLTEPRPAPLAMTADQILDWQSEWSEAAIRTEATTTHGAFWTIKCVDMEVSAPTLRGAVQLAAGKWKEVNC